MKTIYSVTEDLKQGYQLWIIQEEEKIGKLLSDSDLDFSHGEDVEIFFFEEDYPNISHMIENPDYACRVKFDSNLELFQIGIMRKKQEETGKIIWEEISSLTNYHFHFAEGLLDLEDAFLTYEEEKNPFQK